MKEKENIDRFVKETLDSVSSIESVKAPPFFKDKVLRKMKEETNDINNGARYLNWFTPQYQAAALICFIVINAYALFYSSTDNYIDNVENFAEVYGLSETDTDSYLYQN